MNEDLLDEIITACQEDERLREILGRILSMGTEERKDFRRKMNLFFLGKDNPADSQTRSFFQTLLTSDNAENVGRKVGLI